MTDYLHQPVLLQTTLDALDVKPKGVYFDCTLGSAGHSLEILKLGGTVYGLDVDPEAIKRAKQRVLKVCPDTPFTAVKANFLNLAKVAKDFKVKAVDGILFDLGLSSDQLADEQKGFSFQTDAPLDMRADPDLAVTAKDLINGLMPAELHKLLALYGEEPFAKAITRAIVNYRQQKPITTTQELSNIICSAKKRSRHLHPATLTFQALRLAVNDEINNLKSVLPQAVTLLKPHGRLVVISFHSLEDRVVKQFIANNRQLINLTKHPIVATQSEINQNPKARSAKLRAAQKK